MKCGVKLLNITALIAGLSACGMLFLASVADFWLFTYEPILRVHPAANGTEISNWEKVSLHSGLWRACIFYSRDLQIPPQCTNIGYNQAWDHIDGSDTTNSILRGIRRSTPLIMVGLAILLMALIFSTLGNTKSDIKTLIGAVHYIFAALFLGLGMIFYISAVNDEVSRLKEPESDKEPTFAYAYGWAVMCAGASFVAAMIAAVTDISIYLRRYGKLEDMGRLIPGLNQNGAVVGAKVGGLFSGASASCSLDSHDGEERRGADQGRGLYQSNRGCIQEPGCAITSGISPITINDSSPPRRPHHHHPHQHHQHHQQQLQPQLHTTNHHQHTASSKPQQALHTSHPHQPHQQPHQSHRHLQQTASNYDPPHHRSSNLLTHTDLSLPANDYRSTLSHTSGYTSGQTGSVDRSVQRASITAAMTSPLTPPPDTAQPQRNTVPRDYTTSTMIM